MRDKERGASTETAVERSYEAIKEMAEAFTLRPGERLNESELSRQLGVSRTPLREAMNRLVSENFLDFVPSKGFFRKVIKPREIYELYELRWALETAAARFAVIKGSDVQIAQLGVLLEEFAPMETRPVDNIVKVVQYDERFHEMIAGMSGNSELVAALRSVNVRIRPLRYLGIGASHLMAGQKEHKQMFNALRRRDADTLAALLGGHVGRRLDEIEGAVRELYGMIYVDG
ncbi:MAG: GntR family transcriptional regulator [Janthinobacterium lividum]